MQVVGAFMTINVSWYNMEKYQLKWLRVFSCIERTWIQVLCMSFVCYLIYYYFNNKVFDNDE